MSLKEDRLVSLVRLHASASLPAKVTLSFQLRKAHQTRSCTHKQAQQVNVNATIDILINCIKKAHANYRPKASLLRYSQP